MSSNHVNDTEKLHGLVSATRQVAGSLLTKATNVSNLDLIGKQSRLLITSQIGETLTHMQDQGSKVLSAVKTSKQVYYNLQSLQTTLTDTQKFFSDLDAVSIISIHNKTKYKNYSNRVLLSYRIALKSTKIVKVGYCLSQMAV